MKSGENPHGDEGRPDAANGSFMALFSRAPHSSALAATACFGAGLLACALLARPQPELAAASNQGREDLDRDGLTDLQEQVIGTNPARRDTDGDGYSDLEERARGSDPREPLSVPDPSEFGLGMFASAEDGIVSLASAVYLHQSDTSGVSLEVGLVYRGRVLRLAPRAYSNARGFLYPGRDPGDTLVVVELAVPEVLVRRLGQVNMFSVVRGTAVDAPDPIVSIFPLRDFSGVTVSVEPSAARLSGTGNGQPTGVVYRPLAGDDDIPATWTGGEICFQKTSAVGMSGVSIVHEVEAADCHPMDTYCSPADCAAGIGTGLELPDPAALAGG